MHVLRSFELLVFAVGIALLLVGLTPASASSANISRSYSIKQPITAGSLVSLDPVRSGFVQPANSANGKRLVGVAVSSSESLIAVDVAAGKAQIATSGTVNVLVSTLNGAIKVGDQVSVSPFHGVGMKAQAGERIIGLAQTTFSANTDGARSQTVTDRSGTKQTVRVGFTRVNIAIGTATPSGAELNGLQQIVEDFTGRHVSTMRIILSLLVLVAASVTLITLIYGAIYGSIISIGRNPLARYAIFRTLGAVLSMAALTVALTFTTIFFLLR